MSTADKTDLGLSFNGRRPALALVAVCWSTLSFVVPATDASELAPSGNGTNYQSPVDGKSYGADWRGYYPRNPFAAKPLAGRVQVQGIRLLSTQAEFDRSIVVSDLGDFILKTGQAIDASLGVTNNGFQLVVQTRLTKDKKPFFALASSTNVCRLVLQRIYDSLGGLPDYRSGEDDLTYEVRFAVTTGAATVEQTNIIVPPGFVVQILEPSGGRILRPTDWFYREAHSGASYTWILSREDASKGAYITGVKIVTLVGVRRVTGKTARNFVLEFAETRKKAAAKVLKECPETNQELFSRFCLETEEGPDHILYSLFYGNKELDIAVISIAGTKREFWDTYSSVFDQMAAFELIDMKRFQK